MFVWNQPTPPGPSPSPDPSPVAEENMELDARMRAFHKLGFDPWLSFVLAWRDASPADVRERFLKHGATHEQVAEILS